ncbi:unnamed protein product [Nezara viridula]|uniref:GDP-D-glucose phosphorylase 1 n=1 Tax=Nezara viridula TaxID=85310 RepID=A0A9P0HD20_NEZVI|nr:unnamed protein product [Nezara viridula]
MGFLHSFSSFQLNTDRAVNKRTPEIITSVNQPFSIDSFNFTRANQDEIMFFLTKSDGFNHNENRNAIMINVSPLERYHCLLLPSLYECLPQVLLNQEALNLGISSVLLNGSVEQRAGFNSLGGYASVNHLHFHTYYLNNPMKLETIEVEHLMGRCYILENYPAKAFVFQVKSKEELSLTVNDIHLLVNLFIEKNVAHNLFISRGLSFERSKCSTETSKRDCVRIYLWARTPTFGSKALDEFNPALCELFGHLVIKTSEAYDELTEARVAEILFSITHEPYSSLKESVKELYNK